jgi:hypothetical protein
MHPLSVELDMRDRVKLNEKIDKLFNDHEPLSFPKMMRKELYQPDVYVIVLGKSELLSLFPTGTISIESLNKEAPLRL